MPFIFLKQFEGLSVPPSGDIVFCSCFVDCDSYSLTFSAHTAWLSVTLFPGFTPHHLSSQGNLSSTLQLPTPGVRGAGSFLLMFEILSSQSRASAPPQALLQNVKET